MRVNLFSLYAGPRGSYGPGICDVPDDIAKDLIEAAVAIPIVETRTQIHDQPAAIEESVSEDTTAGQAVAAETAALPSPARRTNSRRGHAAKPSGDI